MHYDAVTIGCQKCRNGSVKKLQRYALSWFYWSFLSLYFSSYSSVGSLSKNLHCPIDKSFRFLNF